MPYPPGMSERDLKRAGIVETGEECPECGEIINEGDEHKEDCYRRGDDANTIVEDERAAHAEDKLEQRRLEEARE